MVSWAHADGTMQSNSFINGQEVTVTVIATEDSRWIRIHLPQMYGLTGSGSSAITI